MNDARYRDRIEAVVREELGELNAGDEVPANLHRAGRLVCIVAELGLYMARAEDELAAGHYDCARRHHRAAIGLLQRFAGDLNGLDYRIGLATPPPETEKTPPPEERPN